MSSQNSMVVATDRIKDIMLDDKHMRPVDIQKSLLKKRKREDYNPPADYSDKLEIKSVFEKGGVCFYIQPKKTEVTKCFFYIHGGGHCMQINKRQWEFVLQMVEITGYRAAVPIYPLAPERSASEAFEMLMGAYKKLCKDETVERLVVVGDSTGGGLALSMAILAWNSGLQRPNKLVLLSPALDTEFFDETMVRQMLSHKKNAYQYYYTPAIRDFLKQYWVRELLGRTEYTAPVFADLTDICDELAIFTVADDLLNCYARELYNRMKQLQTKVHYYEFFGIIHNYIEHPHVPECRMIIKKIANSIMDEGLTVSEDIKHAVWARTMLAERFPKLFSDPESIKLASRLNIGHKNTSAQYAFYDKAVLLEKVVSMDRRVKQFIRRNADSMIVNVGAELDTMFSRMDNGRIEWYNVDLPERIELRRRYLDSKDREHNIDKSILDFTWMDQIKRSDGQPILFVCCDIMKFFDKYKLKAFFDAIWRRFPGAEVVFDVQNSIGKKKYNFRRIRGKSKGAPIKLSIDNCTSLMYDWNIKYKIIYDRALLDKADLSYMFSPKTAKRFTHAIKRKYDKIIQLRLGNYHFIDSI